MEIITENMTIIARFVVRSERVFPTFVSVSGLKGTLSSATFFSIYSSKLAYFSSSSLSINA